MNYSSKAYYKVRWQLFQSVTAFFITKCDNLLLQSAAAILLQSVTSVITKCDRYCKVRRFYYKVRQVLQSVTIITKCDRTTILLNINMLCSSSESVLGRLILQQLN